MSGVNLRWLDELLAFDDQEANCIELRDLITGAYNPITYREIASSIGQNDEVLLSLSIAIAKNNALSVTPVHTSLMDLFSNPLGLTWTNVGHPIVHVVLSDHRIEVVLMKISNQGMYVYIIAYSRLISFG